MRFKTVKTANYPSLNHSEKSLITIFFEIKRYSSHNILPYSSLPSEATVLDVDSLTATQQRPAVLSTAGPTTQRGNGS